MFAMYPDYTSMVFATYHVMSSNVRMATWSLNIFWVFDYKGGKSILQSDKTYSQQFI